ncbi:MAG: MFS transporter, partial [Alloscardovia omnicolens]|nr:MFS transporter [Alloscardovia omnicolens]
MTQHLSSEPENIEIGEGAQLVHARDSSHILFSLFLMLAGLIMRAPIVVLPIYIEPMAEHLHRDVGSFGIITSLPLVMFVVVSLLVPWLVQKINLTRTFQVASVFIFVGSMLRGVLTWNTMLAGTVLVGIGIAILNIGMPTLVSEKFSQQPGLYTMRYCAAIVVGAIVLVLLSPFVSATIGWQAMLWVMAAMTACPMLLSFFLPQLTVETPEAMDSENKGTHNSVIDLSLLRDVRIWLFIGMFAGQSFLSYTMSAWLPSILNADDVQSVHNTIIMLIFNAIGLPISVGIPFFVARTSRRYHIIAVTALTAL